MMELFGQFWGLYTVLMLVVFVGIWAWAWSSKRKQAFREAADLPFADEAPDKQEGPTKREERHS